MQDSLLIWRAKESGFDNACNIDIQLMCGAGIDRTIEYLKSLHITEAEKAVERICECKKRGDFDDFNVRSYIEFYNNYYEIE